MTRDTGRLATVTLGLVVLLLFGAMLSSAVSEPTAEKGQRITVIDGDTLEIDGRIIRLYGIDAPELGQLCRHDGTWQKCGLAAAFELNKMIEVGDSPVTCEPVGGGRDPSIEVCHKGGLDLAKALLAGGYAMTTPDTDPSYRDDEATAREGRLGLWHSEFMRPDLWRDGARLARAAGATVRQCPIKGVVTADGRHLYYVPFDKNYAKMRVNPKRGGRTFCSDDDARKDGFRRPIESNFPKAG